MNNRPGGPAGTPEAGCAKGVRPWRACATIRRMTRCLLLVALIVGALTVTGLRSRVLAAHA